MKVLRPGPLFSLELFSGSPQTEVDWTSYRGIVLAPYPVTCSPFFRRERTITKVFSYRGRSFSSESSPPRVILPHERNSRSCAGRFDLSFQPPVPSVPPTRPTCFTQYNVETYRNGFFPLSLFFSLFLKYVILSYPVAHSRSSD